MTNMEHLCSMLRKVGRADAAQALESRTDKEWKKCSTYEHSSQILAQVHLETEYAPSLLTRSMLWEATKEGFSYWSEIYDWLIIKKMR